MLKRSSALFAVVSISLLPLASIGPAATPNGIGPAATPNGEPATHGRTSQPRL